MEKPDVPEQGKEKGEGGIFESEVNRAILNTVLDGIITINSDATVVSFNPSAERIFGYSKSEIIGKNVNMLMPEPYHSEHNTYLNNYLTTGVKKVIGLGREVRGRKKDGSEFPLDLAVSEMLVEGRRMFTGIIRDITEKKKAEEAVSRLAAIVESSTDAIIGKTLDGNIFSWNAGAERMYGYKAEEVTGRHISVIVPPERMGELNKNLEALRRGETIESYETARVRKDGSLLNISLTISPLKDPAGRITGFSAIARDVTENKRVEAELRESEAKFRTLSEGALIGIYLIQDMRYAYVNPEFADMLGYSRAELTGMENMLECVYPEQREAARQGIEKIINGQESVGYQGSWLRKDGDPVEVEGKAAFTIFNGRPAIIGTALDVTQRKYLEKQRADFLAMITHDFKSPLTSILGNAELISMMKEGSADQETADMAANIVRNGERLRSLVDDFLVHSRLDSAVLTSELTSADVREILNDVVKDFENQAGKKGQTLNTEFAQDVTTLNLDVTLVQRAVSNLLQNAVNYTPEGGRICLKTERVVNGGRAFLVISVEDTGVGIPLAEQSKIFQKYYRMSRTSRTGGTGLGLAIVKAVADAHNGRVELTSKEGTGSTFKLFIPEDLKKD
ncbi:MAG: PAS domain S-box protein [Nitrospirota bacterium]